MHYCLESIINADFVNSGFHYYHFYYYYYFYEYCYLKLNEFYFIIFLNLFGAKFLFHSIFLILLTDLNLNFLGHYFLADLSKSPVFNYIVFFVIFSIVVIGIFRNLDHHIFSSFNITYRIRWGFYFILFNFINLL